MNTRYFSILMMFLLLIPVAALAQGFDANNLISDERFADIQTLGGAPGIQKFLESKGSVLANTSPDFLTKLREPGDVNLKSRLPDPRPALGRLRSAAELIYDAATSAGLNPQVILVTLQKEQSLITGQFPDTSLQRALDRALGFGCPDEGGCSDIFLGFYYQLFGNFDTAGNRYIGMPASLTRSFNFEIGGMRVGRGPMVDALNNAFGNGNRVRTSRMGDIITLENTQGPPNNALATQAVTLSNFATAALYRYTPHVYNGNYNFYKFFTAWFRYADGTLITSSGDSKIYIIDSGLKRPISSFVVLQRGLDPASIISISSSEFSEFPLGDVTPPKDGTVFRDITSRAFIIENGKKKLLSSFVGQERKIDVNKTTFLETAEVQSYPDGGIALPTEGTLVKSKDSPAVFMISNNQKRPLSLFVFRQRGLKFAGVLAAESGELESYPAGQPMPPADGALVKSADNPAVYHVGNGKLEPLTLFVFQQRSFRFSDVLVVSKDEFGSWEITKPMPPPTGLLVKTKTNPAVYYIESGTKRPVSYGVFLANHFSFKNVVVASDSDLSVIELGDELKLPEQALIKTKDSPAVYIVMDGILRPLTLKAFQNRGFKFSNVVTIPAEEFAKYPVGALVEN